MVQSHVPDLEAALYPPPAPQPSPRTESPLQCLLRDSLSRSDGLTYCKRPEWNARLVQSRDNLSNPMVTGRNSSRIVECSRTHLGRCLGAKGQAGRGCTDSVLPAPPGPAQSTETPTNKTRHSSLLTAIIQTIFLYASCRAGEPAGAWIPDPRKKL